MTRIYLTLVDPTAPTSRTYGEGPDALVVPIPPSQRDCVQEEPCLDPRYGDSHTEDRLWVIKRRTKPWGHFATATINGEVHVLDASLPTTIEKLPRDAKVVSREDNARLWHDSSESHVFGGPDVGKALRAVVAAANGGVR